MASRPSPWTLLCEDLNSFGQQLSIPLEIGKRSHQKNLQLVLYARVVSLFQDISNYTNRGRVTATRPLVRALIDTTMAIAAVAREPALVRSFMETDGRSGLFWAKPRVYFRRDIVHVIQTLNPRHLARRAGILAYYDALLQALIVPAYRDPGALAGSEPVSTEGSLLCLADALHLACEGLLLASRILMECFAVRALDRQFMELFNRYSGLISRSPGPASGRQPAAQAPPNRPGKESLDLLNPLRQPAPFWAT